MIQPKYNPQEALERAKLMMKYDTSKTLTENKKIVSEQYLGPAAAGTAAGAATGAAIGAALPTSLSVGAAGTGAIGTGAASGLVYSTSGALGVGLGTAGAIVGGAAALAVLPLVYWMVTKDKGSNKVRKMFEMCSSEGTKIEKLQRKIQDSELRSMTDDIEDAVNYQTLGIIPGGTDEEKLFGAFKKIESGTAADFCALVKYYNSHSDSGDLFDDLDSDIDSEEEWKQIYRPIRNCVEDSLLALEKTDVDCKANPKDPRCKVVTPKKGYTPYKWKDCSGTYSEGCKADAIGKVQSCLGGLTVDNKFGPKTAGKLKEKGFTTFTDADIEKICGGNKPEIGGEVENTSASDT